MWKKVLLGIVGVFLIACLGLFLWVRSVLASDAVQVALAGQISNAIGQPVTIGDLGASIYPRIGVTLKNVGIGKNAQITVQALAVGADFRALLSRRIEHATVHLDGARIQMPLPPLTLGSESPATTPAPETSTSPVEIGSIDEVILNGIEIVSGGRTLKGDVDVVPQGKGVVIRTITLTADDMSLTATGQVTDLAGPTGEIAVKAGALNVDRLIAFFNDFSGGLAQAEAPASPAAPTTASPVVPASTAAAAGGSMHLSVTIDADRATIGELTIEHMAGRAVAHDSSVTLEPLTFGLFGGKYDGGLTVTLGTEHPTFRWKAAVSGIDVAAATAFAGSPNTATGTLAGTVDLSGTGSDAAMAMRTVAGMVRLDITNGVVRNLGIVRSVGTATSMSFDGLKQASASAKDTDEPFTKLGATVTLADGAASTQDLKFEAADLLLLASGVIRLDGRAINLKGQVQLSEGLSQQVHHTMLKLSQDNGRVILPATITGSVTAPVVRVDAKDIAKRALKNTATEVAPTLLKKGLSGLMRR